MKIFISQPLFERTYDEILKKRQLIIDKLWNEFGKDIEVIDCFTDYSASINPILYLEKNLDRLRISDLIYFSSDWFESKNSQMEHTCAMLYHKNIEYENKCEIKKGKGIVHISYVENKLQINAINCTSDVLFEFAQFQPFILSSSINKNKSYNFQLYILDKFADFLCSKAFQESCKKKGIIIQIENDKIYEKIHEKARLKEVLNGEQKFQELKK